ncbi:uroporphyrinogen decarboxylase family protein [Marinisporobacter balticus]|uniref:Uroporphyrinogen decarboxylase n=1 Tax=Marinisporobacter balticus TaxID=2018667 RepID=A0A4V2SAR7_9FIRM|nr:uroporphyrinogen decarboxylase family protein [Marinisporobacter balticus]TCO72700.1 uroporphyrinogen decarboxylase [Marinisporobacter balticus]
MLKDKMTPMERAIALGKGEKVDRLPCNPNVANGVARIYGCKISEFNTSAKAIANAQIASYRRFGYDGVRIFTDLFPWAEAIGAKVNFPEDNTADLQRPAIDDISKISQLQPADPYKDGRLPMHIEAMKYLLDEVGNEVPCAGGVVGPFTNAFFLIGIERMIKLFFKNPQAVHKLCEVSLETCIRYAQAIIDTGLTPTISEPMSSCTVVSPKHFREFGMPYLKRFVEFINSKGKGVTMHICGKTDKIWEDIVSMGVAGFSIDNVVDLKKCKNQIGDRVKILGHVDPASIMYGGSPKDVRRAVVECVQQAWDSPKGYVIMSGCSLPVETPFENIDAMMDTTREIGYPVNIEKLDRMLRD